MAKKKKAPPKKRSNKALSRTQINRLVGALSEEAEAAIDAAQALAQIADRYPMIGQAERAAAAYQRDAAALAYVALQVSFRAGQLAAVAGAQ